MSDIAIRVEGLSKLYRLGEAEGGYRTLRESLTDTFMAPFRRLRRGPSPKREAETIWALKDVSFDVKHGEVIGIIGRNGAGKSTLLKILSRITEPTEGHAEIHGRVGSLLEVGTGFHPELTGRENIFLNGAILGMKKAEILQKFDEIVAFAEVERFIDTAVKYYSSGMYLRLAFSVAAHLETEILMVDEVLAVGDIAFQKKCMGKMSDVSAAGKTVIFVSHNLHAIRALCPKSALVRNGHLEAFGPTDDIVNHYEVEMIAGPTGALPPGWLFAEAPRTAERFQITGIQMLDGNERPKARLHTWDHVNFRIYYRASAAATRGSVVLQLKTPSGISVMLCSTQPDSGMPLEIRPGDHFIDCEFPCWPLGAGTCVISAALAVPMLEWLTPWAEGILEIAGKDVFGSGILVPALNRALVAAPHTWRLGRLLEEDSNGAAPLPEESVQSVYES